MNDVLARWMPRRGSLRTQLIVWNVLALTLLLGGLGFVIRYTVVSTILVSVDRELEKQSHPPAPGGDLQGRPLPPDDPRRLGPQQDGPGPQEEGEMPPPPVGQQGGPQSAPPPPRQNLRPRTYDLDEHPIGMRMAEAPWDQHAFEVARQGQPIFSTVTVNGEPLRVFTHPFPMRPPYQGVVQAAYPMTDIYRAIAGLNRALLILIPVALLCAAAGGSLLTDQVLRRVRRLSHAAGQIGEQDFSDRLPVIGDDEFSELAETFNGMLGRLETAFRKQERLIEQQRRFTADASHELKTPLTIIKGNTSMALSGRPSEAVYHDSMEEIDRAADTMSHLVKDLLLLARSDGGQLGRDPIELLVREILERAISRVPRTAASAKITLAVADETLSVRGNEQELVRLFSNLLENAVRYTPADGTIRATARRVGNAAVIAVADTGIGIAPQHLPHLGERFYRVDDSRARPDGGTGLGLSICRGIVQAHRGTITFQSTPGLGTTVTVTLPAS